MVTPWKHLGALALAASQGFAAQQTIDLSNSSWTLHNTNGSISIPAKVPSQVQVDLQNAGIIGDPLYGFNDVAYSWIPKENWTYISEALTDLKPGFLERTWLIFDGLDTYATIRLCDQILGQTDNMFKQFIFDATSILQSCKGNPSLSLDFGSTPQIGLAESNSHSGGDGVSFSAGCNSDNPNGCRVWVRKQANDFGWDWAPTIIPVGPWQKIYAVKTGPLDPIYVNNAAIDVYRQGQMNNLPPDQSKPWVFNASLDFIGTLLPKSKLSLDLKDASGKTVVSRQLSGVYQSGQTITGSTTIDPSQVQQWWPNGMGDQVLYTAEVSVISAFVVPVAQVQRRVGFRTIIMNLAAISDAQLAKGVAPGANWHFEINGNEMYAKGSNFVPPVAFWSTVTQTQVQRLLESAKNANMNMLRVWSSGSYLADFIYDLADEMGILLWSEFEFTDSPYPDDPDYLQIYEAEAYYNVRRINHHPSLALWAGGNELEAVMLQFGGFNPDTPSNFNLKYTHIQEELLIKCVYANSKSISYIPSSTYHGYLQLDFNSVRPQLPRYLNTSGPNYIYSDTDYYDTNPANSFNFKMYPIGRFADEFGVISFPSIQSWKTAAPARDLYAESPTVIHHNRNAPFGAPGGDAGYQAGVEIMLSGVTTWLPPPNLSDMVANFTAWIYSTQVQQADYLQHQMAFYRRGSGFPERQLGSLFWMLDDLWVGSTWASIESSGRQKILYYAAKDIYQPVIVYSYYDEGSHGLETYVTSDRFDSVSGTFSFEWLDWSGNALTLSATNSSASNMTVNNGFARANQTTNSAKPSATNPRINIPFIGPNSFPLPNANIPQSHAAQPTLAVPEAISMQAQTGNTTTQSVGIGAKRFEVGALNTTLVLRYEDLNKTLTEQGRTLEDAVLRVSIKSDDNQYQHYSYFHPTAISANMLKDPGLTLENVGGSSWKVTATKAVAAWVWLDSGDAIGRFSDNGFWLRKGESQTVTFEAWEGEPTMTVRSLFDNTLP